MAREDDQDEFELIGNILSDEDNEEKPSSNEDLKIEIVNESPQKQSKKKL